MISLSAAADRFFRLYSKHCMEPDEDTLFALLNALHSFNDKFRSANMGSLFDSTNFIALKALRNLFHHETELLHEIKIIPARDLPAITTDLVVVCLVERSLVERAARHNKNEQDRVMSAFKWYGSIANIQPSVFNVAVDVFEAIQPLDPTPSSSSYLDFEASYEFEETNGHAHRVTGDILSHACDVDEVLRLVFRQ